MVHVPHDLIRALPKTDLHLHLDGSLRVRTLIELARERRIALPSQTAEGLREQVFKPNYANLNEYLEGFRYTVGVLQDTEALERVAYELAQDNQEEGVRYIEVRFAPQLHVNANQDMSQVLTAVDRGLRRAKAEFNSRAAVQSREEPPFEYGIIVCALRFFTSSFGECYSTLFRAHAFAPKESVFSFASLELARAVVLLRDREGLQIVGFDLAGQEKGYPAGDHQAAYQYVHEHFMGKTVHAGEDYGPESIFQAITDCHADRLGHGTWLFSTNKITDPSVEDKQGYVDQLAQYIADRRITIEVCLTSNQQTIPELVDLKNHPFRRMRRHRLSTSICTDNRLVSRTTVTDEVAKAVEYFELDTAELRDVLIYGFKRSFFPGSYREKRAYVRRVIDFYEDVHQHHASGSS